ncbi:MAG: sorbosone dehydrogenase family protein [Erythrobacter sp.]|nr:sorbosone dehydrogenase family protein [Erythrobacter sp.]
MKLWKKILVALLILLVLLAGLLWWLTRPVPATLSLEETTGTDPTLVAPEEQTIPTVGIAEPVGWQEGEAPTAAEGLVVNRFADGLDHPRVIYTMPNGDVLVAEARAPEAEVAGGWLTNLVASFLFSEAGSSGESPNRIVLLRDTDGDGVADETHVLRESDLDSPSGMAWVDGHLYVANHDELLRFTYAEGANELTGEPEKIADLPAAGNHWMRNIALSPDGERLYVAVGSASNVAEGGMEIEQGRAAIHEINLESGSARTFAAGLRNPNGLAWNPWTGELWTTVNERDMLGSDLVPDYMGAVPIGAHYGWPWFYYATKVDDRVEGRYGINPDYVRFPDFALGAHVAALGLVFTQEGTMMGQGFGPGAFVARHGSWNRVPLSGYDVVFVRFDDRGSPTGEPVPVLTGFLADQEHTHGRPTWLAWDRTGALLVSDDTGNAIWRVTSPGATPAPAIVRNHGERLPPRRNLIGDPARAFEDGAVNPADVM